MNPVRYMLDTNTVIYIRDGRIPRSRLERLTAGSVVMSIISYGELFFGSKKKRQLQTSGTLHLITLLIPPVVMDLEVARVYGQIRADLAARGEPIGANDNWIAAHAMALRATLVTNNEREFRRVPGLKIENWLPILR